MTLGAGTRIGAYEILAALGEGGMGEVYRARDTRLDRSVAIKILPPSFASDEERAARFEREAKTLAALNHPQIAQVYGLEQDGSHFALVMELVEGEDLAQRIARGPIAMDEALPIARQIAEALEAAHDHGIVHRDLKPANVKVRADGTVKVLDFGLAKVLDPPEGASGAANGPGTRPTMTTPAQTVAGMILGTPAYMAPEQARGKVIDKRADIWAFGAVLYEMLTGRVAFDGDTVTDLLAAIVTREPDWSELPASTPEPVRTLLRRCLEREPRRRLRDVGEARLALSELNLLTPPMTSGARRPAARAATILASSRTRGFVWFAAGLALGGLLSGVWFTTRQAAPSEGTPVVRFDVPVPPKFDLRLFNHPAVAVSLDGATLAFVATSGGQSHLFVRRRDQAEARMLGGTEGAREPVFSPDGKWIAFSSGSDLKKVALDGPVVTLGQGIINDDSRGIAWTDQNVVVFAPDPQAGLFRIPADGGKPEALTREDNANGERTHRWPVAMSGRNVVLFTVGMLGSPDDYENARIDAVDVATGARHTVFSGASMARVASPTGIIVGRGGILYTIPIDASTLKASGAPSVAVSGVAGDITSGAVHFAIARDGTLVYIPGETGSAQRRLVWADRSGSTTPIDLQPAIYNDVTLSPDATRAAMLLGPTGSGDVYIYDFLRAAMTRLTFEGRYATPLWSPDGRAIYYTEIHTTGGKTVVFRKPADGSRDGDAVATVQGRFYLGSIDSTGSMLYGDSTVDGANAVLLSRGPTGTGRDIVRASVSSRTGAPETIVATPMEDFNAVLSPNGRWLAYASEVSGRPEVYVRDLSGGGGQWQVSSSGGEEPRWSLDGGEIYFRVDTQFMAAGIEQQPAFRVGKPAMLFDGVFNLRVDSGNSYSIDPSGRRFLMIRRADASAIASAAIRVVVNGFEAR